MNNEFIYDKRKGRKRKPDVEHDATVPIHDPTFQVHNVSMRKEDDERTQRAVEDPVPIDTVERD